MEPLQTMRFTDYDPMAWLYATHWGGEYHEQGYSLLNKLLFRHLPAGARILDLCCGDGRMAQQLSLAGFHITGIDGSERMLDYARERAPEVEFIAGDARDFTLEHPVDAVICTFDALNHVGTTAELDRVFGCVARVLQPGASFVFDLNREEAYTKLWTKTYAVVQPEMAYICKGGYDAGERIAHANFTVFRLYCDRWDRSDFRMTQHCHHQVDVVESLYRAGFIDITALDAASDLGMFGNIGKGRNYYVARKPA